MGYELNEQLSRLTATHDAGSLTEEVLLAKAILNMRLSQVKSEAEQLAIMPQVMAWLVNIDKLVCDHRRFEEQSGRMLRKTAIQNLGREIVAIIAQHLKPLPGSDQIIAAIAADIVKAIEAMQNPDDKDDDE